MAEKENEPYITRPNHDEALAAQIKAEPPAGAVQVNPNVVGSEVEGEDGGSGTYVGTDPIYQNSSSVANQPFDAQEGVDQLAEDRTKEIYDLSDEDEENVAPDYGLGGEASVARPGGPVPTVAILPGQEGYDKEKAEEQQGPALLVDAKSGVNSEVVEREKAEDDKDEDPNAADNPGQNLASTVNPPVAPEAPGEGSDGEGDKPAKKTAPKQSRQ